MKYGSAFYVENQDKQEKKILVFLDEPATDLPEGAILIVETTDPTELSNTLEPYWLMIQR